jgi:hypothetical protein
MNIKSAARWIFRAAALIVTAVLGVINFRLYTTEGTRIEHGIPVNESVAAQLRFIRTAIEHGADADMQALFPEGRFFMNCLYGLASVEAGLREPLDSNERRARLAAARWALGRVASPESKAVFNPHLKPAYGVFHAGWSAVLHAGVIALQGPGDRDASESDAFQKRCAELAACFSASATPYLQAYSGEAWSCDSAPAIFALYACDRLFPPVYGTVIERWAGQVRALRDPRTGMPGHRVSPDSGARIDGPRATSMCITLRFLAEATPALGRELYESFRSNMMTTRFGLAGVREYPQGISGSGDVDSGPLILGISASASAVTIGAGRIMGDSEAVAHMVPAAEALGFPMTWNGRKRYANGLLPIADAFLAWSQTARPWFETPSHPDWKPFVSARWRVPAHLASFAGAFLILFATFRRKTRGISNRKRSNEPSSLI